MNLAFIAMSGYVAAGLYLRIKYGSWDNIPTYAMTDVEPPVYPSGCRGYHLSYIGGTMCDHEYCVLLRNARAT